jgi:hypothetical protein
MSVTNMVSAPLGYDFKAQLLAINPEAVPTIVGTTDDKLNVEVYETYWKTWEQTLQERTDYNKYYTNLLFIDALVAVLVAALGTSELKLLNTSLVVMLLAAVFFVAAVIAAGWCIKLCTIRNVIRARERTLTAMGAELKIPYNLMAKENEEIGEQPAGAHRIYTLNYYLIPVILVAVFAFLFLVMAFKYFGYVNV